MIDVILSTLFWIGAVGMIACLMIGGLHFGPFHSGHSGQAGHTGQAGHGGHGAGSGHGSRAGRGAGWLTSALSPVTVFGAFLGAGATGLILRNMHSARPEVAIGAAIGALVIPLAFVRPILRFIVRFASRPSAGMAGAIAHDAVVLTPFDESGRGVVRLTVDGQVVRALATLDPDSRAGGAAPAAGEILTVIAVDSRSNSCRVARI